MPTWILPLSIIDISPETENVSSELAIFGIIKRLTKITRKSSAKDYTVLAYKTHWG